MVTPEINRRRAVFVLGKIDEILSWEKAKEQEKDVRVGDGSSGAGNRQIPGLLSGNDLC